MVGSHPAATEGRCDAQAPAPVTAATPVPVTCHRCGRAMDGSPAWLRPTAMSPGPRGALSRRNLSAPGDSGPRPNCPGRKRTSSGSLRSARAWVRGLPGSRLRPPAHMAGVPLRRKVRGAPAAFERAFVLSGRASAAHSCRFLVCRGSTERRQSRSIATGWTVRLVAARGPCPSDSTPCSMPLSSVLARMGLPPR